MNKTRDFVSFFVSSCSVSCCCCVEVVVRSDPLCDWVGLRRHDSWLWRKEQEKKKNEVPAHTWKVTHSNSNGLPAIVSSFLFFLSFVFCFFLYIFPVGSPSSFWIRLAPAPNSNMARFYDQGKTEPKEKKMSIEVEPNAGKWPDHLVICPFGFFTPLFFFFVFSFFFRGLSHHTLSLWPSPKLQPSCRSHRKWSEGTPFSFRAGQCQSHSSITKLGVAMAREKWTKPIG